MPSTQTDNKPNSTLLAFKPRQVLLGSQTMKHRCDNNGSSTGNGLKLEQKVLLHQSIAHYLERSGFSKTLKKFRSEAQIEKDGSNGASVDLEEICLKYLEIGKDLKLTNNNQKEQVAGKHSIIDEEGKLIADMENASSKKKKKKTDKSESHAPVLQSEIGENINGSKNSGEMTNSSVPETKVILKEKDTDDKHKENKKKKNKLASKSLSDAEDNQFESPPTVTAVKLRDDASAAVQTVNGETEKKSKDKKKKRDKPSSNGIAEELQIGDPNEIVSKKDNFKPSNEDLTDNKKKDSKKRKRLASEEIPADGKADEESKRRKKENVNESKGVEQSAKMDGNLKSDLNSNQENIGESVQGSDQLHKTSGEQINGKINGDLGNIVEKSSKQRSQKKQQGSVEQKEVKAFQRVKADKVVFADERLQDNSYWAKDGAETGYGAKAEEILGQVRGRGFRHEKTKKKRGTYRGGQIDLDSHSIKFNYSDDE